MRAGYLHGVRIFTIGKNQQSINENELEREKTAREHSILVTPEMA